MDANAVGTVFIAGGVLALAIAVLLPLVAMIRQIAESEPTRAGADS
jgi:hypothetical protein